MAAAQTLLADQVTAQVARMLHDAGIAVILLRGPSIARYLHGPGEPRNYIDADLLVSPASFEEVGRILEERGFMWIGEELPDDRPASARPYLREEDGGNADIHRTLAGANADPEVVWAAFTGHTTPIEVGGETLAGLDEEATALVVTLHAAHHGAGFSQQLDDLSRAVERFSAVHWKGACDLAEQVEATQAFGAGLRLVPGGVELADELHLPCDSSPDVLLRAQGAPPLALGFDWLSQTTGLVPRLRIVVAKIFPSPQAVRAWAPFDARRGRLRLVAAYLLRPFYLLWHVVPGYRAWRRAQRLSRPSQR